MKISEFLSENFQFLMVKFSLYLNRRVFVISKAENYTDRSFFAIRGLLLRANKPSIYDFYAQALR